MSKNTERFIIGVCGWMVKGLKLRNEELLIYAYIFQLTQYPDAVCYIDYQLISDWTGLKTCIIKNIIKKMINDGILISVDGINAVYAKARDDD